MWPNKNNSFMRSSKTICSGIIIQGHWVIVETNTNRSRNDLGRLG